MHQWVELYWDTPVIPSSLTVFYTWGPGSIVQILAEPYSNGEWLGEKTKWDIIYEGP